MDSLFGRIDHLVYVVPDLELACAEFAEKTGVKPVFGGRHLTRGTMNALVGLGHRCYLEFLAIDPDNHEIPPPRWMGVDLVTQPTMTRWALATDDLPGSLSSLAAYDPAMGKIEPGQRKTPAGHLLQWSLTPPRPAPAVEIMPFLIDWSQSDFHPADGLESGCRIESFKLYHPQPENVLPTLRELGLEADVYQTCPATQESGRGSKVEIELTLLTPRGTWTTHNVDS
ncbi:hypothetical protein CEQ90_11380 [Lewinellaceae bacterium SD302]|nr:hypothetical protein CEQ90_11380 [Lewinellaceae bacterium SD302]